MIKTCSCGTKIEFKPTEKGSMMPVEVGNLLTIYNPHTRKTIRGYRPHWENCPDSKKYRKKKQTNG